MRAIHAVVVMTLAAVAVPVSAKDPPAEKTVTCKDGTTSPGGRGACRGHGGVDRKATRAGAAAAKPSAPAAARAAGETVTCKDGTTSPGGRGACRGHGGVDRKATRAGAGAPGAGAAAAPAAPPPAPAPRAGANVGAPGAPPARSPRGAGRAAAPAGAKNTDPTGAIAKCKDGTFSHARQHTGACSNHGGVAEWLDQPAR